MSENRSLCYWILGIFSVAFVLVVGVFAHDRGIDQAMIDHLFDFHLDVDHVRQELEDDRVQKEVDRIIEADKQRRHNEFCDEVENWWKDASDAFSSSNEGTYSPPDNKGCRE